MNAKQRRICRRAVEELDREVRIADEDGENYTPRITDRVFALLMRAPASTYGRYSKYAHRTRWVGFADGPRDPRTYGLRCYCGRKAHGFDGPHDDIPCCRVHAHGRIPF